MQIPILLGAALALSACAAHRLPPWVDRPCDGQPAGALCATGESELVSASVEAGKSDAEMVALGRLRLQLKADITIRLQTRTSTTMTGASPLTRGQTSAEDLTTSITEAAVRGARFLEYFFYPNRVAAQRVFVLAVLSPEATGKAARDAEFEFLTPTPRSSTGPKP